MKEKTNLKIGDSVIVKAGVIDPDLEIEIGGWQGRISEINRQDKLICIDWDSLTLKSMPGSIIDQCEEEGLDWSRMYLGPAEVDLTTPRDTEADVTAIIEQLEAEHTWSYVGEAGPDIQRVLAGIDLEDDLAAFEAWEEHLRQALTFPFAAEVAEFQEAGPIRAGDKVTVQSILGIADLYGVLVKVKHKHGNFDFPLCDLDAAEPDSATSKLLKAYAIWFANGKHTVNKVLRGS